LNVLRFSGVRQRDIHIAEPIVPGPSGFEFQMVIEMLKSSKLPGIDKIPAEMFKAQGRIIRPETHKFINSI
jgi:hypothetical protein